MVYRIYLWTEDPSELQAAEKVEWYRCILVFWEAWWNHAFNGEEMKLFKILCLDVKLKNDESKFSPIMTVKCEEQMIKCDKVWSTIVTVGPQVSEPSVHSCFASNHSTFNNIKEQIQQTHQSICEGVNRAIQN